MTDSRLTLLNLLAAEESATGRDLARRLGWTTARAGMAILRARRAGLVRRGGRGYGLSDRGRARLAWLDGEGKHDHQ
jgi:DNA-binding MarR family transcriptional regulator